MADPGIRHDTDYREANSRGIEAANKSHDRRIDSAGAGRVNATPHLPSERDRCSAAIRTYRDAIAKSCTALLPRMTERYHLESAEATVAMSTALMAGAAVLCAAAVGAFRGCSETPQSDTVAHCGMVEREAGGRRQRPRLRQFAAARRRRHEPCCLTIQLASRASQTREASEDCDGNDRIFALPLAGEFSGFPYEVSDLGNVRSFHNGGCKVLLPQKNGSGYLQVVICKKPNQPKRVTIHRLVQGALGVRLNRVK